ncbi:MAG: VWA domain-containing protein [Candidatus Tectimicrobiota bacterium]
MTPRLLAFIHLLRNHGIRLSPAESIDALHSLSHLGVQDREVFRLALRTVLVKSQDDFLLFDTLFERFFRLPRRRQRRRGTHTPAGTDAGQRPSPQAPGNTIQQQLPHPTPSAENQTVSVSHKPQLSGVEDTAQQQLLDYWNEMEQAWQEQVTQPDAVLPRSEGPLPGSQPIQTRLDQPFPPDRLADMYREVERLAMRLLSRQALRARRARRGQFDIRRTVLRGLRSGTEVPFVLAYRRRTITKLRLIVLCDVSGSVWQVSTFLLKLVHTLQREFASVRSCVFVNTVVEVTDLFRRMRFPEDLDALRHYPQLNLFGFSDFGRVFYQFAEDFLPALTRNTVVLILGDARNNAFDPQAWALDEVQQRCRSILWLNPEPRQRWNTSDSVLATYAPYCAHVLECWRLDHLVQAADLLLRLSYRQTDR